mmetsp:Transcript_4874/g.8095  ORF Transcript_4874/g.8095 Transcript_4874/m.8095 type:complete len:443 (+) Transcript_4874:113-1441(+)
MIKKNTNKPPKRGAESPVAPNNVNRNRNSPVRIIGARDRTPVMNMNIPGQRPRSTGNKKPRTPQPEFDDLLSQSARYADYEGDNDSTRINLQGSDLDSLKDIVQNQKKDFEADQAKGRKSPASLRAHSSNFRSRGGNTNNSAKFLYTRQGSKEVDNASDQLSDTTEVEKYISTTSSASGGQSGQTEVTNMILKLASQMDRDEIDNAIAVLEHVKSIAALGEAQNAQSSGRRSHSQRRSKSGPPGISPNRPPYPYSSSFGNPPPAHSSRVDNQASFSTIDHPDDDEEEELLEGNEMDEGVWLGLNANTFRPPSIHNLNIHGRPESEMSIASTINSRASTPMHNKRSPTPGLTVPSNDVSEREREQCPVVNRGRKHSPKSRGFVELNPIKTVALPGILSRDTSASGIASPRSQVNDDMVSVVSSNSSFTAVTASSAGGHSLSAR